MEGGRTEHGGRPDRQTGGKLNLAVPACWEEEEEEDDDGDRGSSVHRAIQSNHLLLLFSFSFTRSQSRSTVLLTQMKHTEVAPHFAFQTFKRDERRYCSPL